MRRILPVIFSFLLVSFAFSFPVVDRGKPSEEKILVKLKENAPTKIFLNIAKDYGFSVEKFFRNTGIYLLKLPEGLPLKEALSLFGSLDFVKYVEEDKIIKLNGKKIPDDPLFKKQWGLDNSRDTDIDMPEAWNKKTDSSNVVVAVVDTGVDYNHEDLKRNIWENKKECTGRKGVDDDGNGYVDDCHGWNAVNDNGNPYDDNGHGTHVAGIIGAVGNNGKGVSGVNWHVKILPLKFMDSSGRGRTSDAIECIEYILDNIKKGVNIKVVNASWGSYQRSKALYDAIKKLKDNDVLFVAAAGNDKNNNDEKPFYPASYNLDNIISVAATDKDDNLADFSNYGQNSVDVAAPGVSILSTYPDNRYKYMSGTSMATPFVSGLSAFVWSYKESFSYEDVKSAIEKNVDKLSSLEGLVKTGGRINAEKTMENLKKDDSKKEPEIRIRPSSYDYGDVYVGDTKKAVFTISNAGNADLYILSVYIQGKNKNSFEIVSNNCPSELKPDKSCSVSIRFTPDSEGTKKAQFVVESNDNENVKKVPLKGKGVKKESGGFFDIFNFAGFPWF